MTLRHVALVVVVGLLTGVITQIGQGVLPDGWSQAANAISPWLAVAFLVGAAMHDLRAGVVAGVATLTLALIGYYGMVWLRFGYGGSTNALVVWGTAALAGGVVYGALGQSWRAGGVRQRAVAIGFLVAAAVAEGIYLTGILPEPSVGAGFMLAGVLAPLVLGRSWGERTRAYAAAVPALALGGIGYVAFIAFYGLVTGV
jgi:hypothetical protein